MEKFISLTNLSLGVAAKQELVRVELDGLLVLTGWHEVHHLTVLVDAGDLKEKGPRPSLRWFDRWSTPAE